MADGEGFSADEGILLVYLILAFLSYSLFFTPWVTSDGLSYYAYLRSLTVDGDLYFGNEFEALSRLGAGEIKDASVVTETGYYGNRFSIGPALMWSPFYLFSQLKYDSILSHNELAGYGQRSVWYAAFATFFYSFLGLLLLDNLLERVFSKTVAFYSTVLIWLSTPLLYYMLHEPTMSHGLSFFAVTLFVCWWHAFRRREGWVKYALLGLTGGLMTVIRWQDAIFFLLPVYDLYRACQSDSKLRPLLLKRSLVMFSVAFLVFSPQMVAWKVLYGSFLTVPQGEGFFDFLHPRVLQLLFSTHGLLTWTPLYLVSIAGFYFLYRRDRNLAVPILIVLAANILFNGFLVDWHGHWSFGARRLVNCIPLFALGLAAFLEHYQKRIPLAVLFTALLIFTAWNILLLTQITFQHNLINYETPYTTLIENQGRAVEQLSQLVRYKLFN